MIFILVVSLISLDQLSKFLISKNLFLGQTLPVIQGVMHLSLVHNRGAAFGILKNQLPFFIFCSILALVLIGMNLKHRPAPGKKVYNLALALILAGAAGNLIDRLFFGYVIDFIDLRVWPVFNIADSCITAGAILLGWAILKYKN
jgi:signal peptidase II